ncbi:hypothetical protein E2C01_004716 [Portunus trituberculatus]|uniref:Uncharacterized protein n=1 Tax=Portunus trituberculatus TaxID=210409 RepID=A0A5B7CRA7_PORTR|nr:hypothetical protein [Portunus trituberculatus]
MTQGRSDKREERKKPSIWKGRMRNISSRQVLQYRPSPRQTGFEKLAASAVMCTLLTVILTVQELRNSRKGDSLLSSPVEAAREPLEEAPNKPGRDQYAVFLSQPLCQPLSRLPTLSALISRLVSRLS